MPRRRIPGRRPLAGRFRWKKVSALIRDAIPCLWWLYVVCSFAESWCSPALRSILTKPIDVQNTLKNHIPLHPSAPTLEANAPCTGRARTRPWGAYLEPWWANLAEFGRGIYCVQVNPSSGLVSLVLDGR